MWHFDKKHIRTLLNISLICNILLMFVCVFLDYGKEYTSYNYVWGYYSNYTLPWKLISHAFGIVYTALFVFPIIFLCIDIKFKHEKTIFRIVAIVITALVVGEMLAAGIFLLATNICAEKDLAFIPLIISSISVIICAVSLLESIYTYVNERKSNNTTIIKAEKKEKDYDTLIKLNELLKNGIITQEEFNTKKEEFLKEI